MTTGGHPAGEKRAFTGHAVASDCGPLPGSDLRPGAGRVLPRLLPAAGASARGERVGAQPARWPGRGGLRGTGRGRRPPGGMGAPRPFAGRGGRCCGAGRAARGPEHLPDQVAAHRRSAVHRGFAVAVCRARRRCCEDGVVAWIELDGAVNVRDLGGLPTEDGGKTADGRLLRGDNLQELSPADVATLVDEIGVTTEVDLRSESELAAEGRG